MRNISKAFVVLGLLVALVTVSSGAYASAFRIRIENLDTGIGIVVTDNGTGDSASSNLGIISFSDFSGNIFSVTTGMSQPFYPLAGGSSAEMHLNSVVVSTLNAARIQVTMEDMGFNIDSNGFHSINGLVGGTFTAPAGSTATFQTWVNPSNLVPTLGPDIFPSSSLLALGATPSGSIAAFSPAFVAGPGAFSFSGGAGFEKLGPYSLFSQGTVVFTGAGTLSFDLDTTVTPEPSALLLLGSGLAAIGFFGRNKLLAGRK
jgi:hypothetical protein